MKPKVFVGSSSEQLKIAEVIEVELAKVAEVTSWTQAFTPGQPTFSDLISLKDKFDFAIIVFSPDDIVESRSIRRAAPRDNLVFELGLFLGSLGDSRVLAVFDKSQDTKIMSDYFGVNVLKYDLAREDGDIAKALRPTCIQIKQRLEEVGPRLKADSRREFLFPGEMIGLSKIYDSMASAEADILQDLENDPGPIRLFFHIASKNLGLKGSLFDHVDSIAQSGEVDVRIMHASLESPLFSRDRLVSLSKDPERVLSSLQYVENSLSHLEELAGASFRRRTHKYPFIWRMYGLSRKLYLMPYFSSKDATETSPVLCFEKRERSLFNTFADWFDNVWHLSTPHRVSLTEIISKASPAGSAIIAKWNGLHVFGIPRRDLKRSKDVSRFYGLGGKRLGPDESFEDCALREVREETSGNPCKLITSSATHYLRADGELTTIELVGMHTRPRLILEKQKHSGWGSMRVEDDKYYLVAFDAEFESEPQPSNEIGVILFATDNLLQEFGKVGQMPLSAIAAHGGKFLTAPDLEVSTDTFIRPHGSAEYLTRMFS